jgi:hypothetical protein
MDQWKKSYRLSLTARAQSIHMSLQAFRELKVKIYFWEGIEANPEKPYNWREDPRKTPRIQIKKDAD